MVSFGFPLKGVLSTSGNLTIGNLSALAGIDGDLRALQSTAPTQHGNSGGPLLDQAGNVIGVSYQGLNDYDIDNAAFAIKSDILAIYLKSNNVAYSTAHNVVPLPATEIAKKANKYTAQVICYQEQ